MPTKIPRKTVNPEDRTPKEIALERIQNAVHTKATSLDLNGLDLTSIPKEIALLTDLKELDLGRNKLKSLPDEVFSLTNLEVLRVGGSHPENINEVIDRVEDGRQKNRLDSVIRIHEAEKIPALATQIGPKGNLLEGLPTNIVNLRHLRVLDICSNHLKRVPQEIFQLKGLVEIDLSYNEIQELPSRFRNLTNIEILDFRHNKVGRVPMGIFDLNKLRYLNFSENPIQVLPPEIEKCNNLIILNLGGCNLDRLPEAIGKLVKLRWLVLEGNHLASLPSNISRLSEMEVFEGNKNKISALPHGMRELKKLHIFNVLDNPLGIPPEIAERFDEPKSILNYYFSTIEQKRKAINEIKLLIVGQGSVGKTSIVQQILYGVFDPNQTKTEGISINQWTIDNAQQTVSSTVDGQLSIKLNIWDFGGQEIMHATHQFFLTKRSLYLLALDARLTQEENRVEYWLKIIQSYGGESPILIVGNKTDQHPLDIDRTGLQKKYPNIVGIIETSAATGAGIAVLKAEIIKQVATLPHVRDLLPETWFMVKSKLEELGRDKNFITQDEYFSMCSTNEVTDETSQHTLIGFLHDLGVVLHFQDDPRLEALGILNPQWVTNGVYKILNAKSLFKNKGVLTRPMLNNILKSQSYPSNKRMFIVDMMKKFELCYDLEKDTTFLVPDLLPKDEPRELDFGGIPAFQYDYPVLPSSIITRLIVRMNQNIYEEIVWRTGVLLKIGKNLALVKADIEDKKISIVIDGVEYTRRDALSAIRFQLDEIHYTIKGLDPQKRIPIPNAPDAEPLDYEYLLQLERDGDLETLPVKNGDRLVKVNIRQLLSGVESEALRQQSTANITNIYVAGDVRGSNVIVGNENTATIVNKSFNRIYRKIERSSRTEAEKKKLTTQVKEIEQEVAKGDQASESFLSRRLRNLKKMAPDIADVALSALTGPGMAISMIVKKVAKKIKDETK
jgi:internalin A